MVFIALSLKQSDLNYGPYSAALAEVVYFHQGPSKHISLFNPFSVGTDFRRPNLFILVADP